MDNRGVGKTELFRYNTALRKELKFVDDLNSHACQTAVERTLRAITRFYDNCQNKIKGKKGYPQHMSSLLLGNSPCSPRWEEGDVIAYSSQRLL
jgi:transposase